MEELEDSYIQLTRQQASLLDFLEEQKTAVVHGLAGTGKTVIAVEKAKRIASQNESVLFLCFNSFLRDMLRENQTIPNVTFHNAHSLAYEIMGPSDSPIEEVLSEFEEYLEVIFDEENWKYSNIIVDEGQDLDDRLLNRLYELVRAKHGCFYVFYDRNQYIMKNQSPKWIDDAECRLVLHKNCRNTAEVFKTSCSVMGLENMTPNDVHGEIPSVKFYQTEKELETIVGEFIKRCVVEGLQSNDIVILTAKTTEASWLATNSKYSGIGIAERKEPGKILFTTIRKFKGLEAKIEDTLIAFNSSTCYLSDATASLSQQLSETRSAIDQLSFAFQEDLQKLKENLGKFSITLFGRTMTGKSTLMEILTHGDGASIGRGSQRTTLDVRSYYWNDLEITDVPGTAAVGGEEDESVAFEAAKAADLILFLTSDDGIQASEAECFSRILEMGKPVICIMNVKVSIAGGKSPKRVEKKFDFDRLNEIRDQF